MKVKICGLTRTGDALAAAAAGADMIGFVFARSPRRVSPEAARAMIAAVRGAAGSAGAAVPLAVGVFVDEPPGEVARVAALAGLDVAQLHGTESPDLCRSLPLPVIKALRVAKGEDLARAGDYAGAVGYLLLDARLPGAAGGTGKSFDWSLAAGASLAGVPWLLAGGLNPGNVARAVRACRPDGVDVSTGVEVGPGIKDRELMASFVKTAKEEIR